MTAKKHPPLTRYADGDLVCPCDLVIYPEEFGCGECGANITNIVNESAEQRDRA